MDVRRDDAVSGLEHEAACRGASNPYGETVVIRSQHLAKLDLSL